MSATPVMSGDYPAVGVVAGHSVVLHYGDVAAEYAALRTGAMLVDRSARCRVSVEGAQAAEVLTGLLTNDVKALTPGHGSYAAALTPKGKVIADVRLFADRDGFLADVPPRATAGWLAVLKKYVNPRLAPYRDESAKARDVGIFGPAARRIAVAVLGVQSDTLAALPPYGHLVVEVAGQPVRIARVPDLELEGYELFVPSEMHGEIWHRLVAAGATPSGLLAWDIARIEAGRPEWGVDIDDSTIPQEVNFDELHAISYTKGCYVGQEVVARVHFRGHVNRHLRGLLCGQTEPPPEKAALIDDKGKQVGEVRSSAMSPRLGAIALAMVRREVEPGRTLTVQWDHGEAQADVSRLPFPL
ncbi:MAG TPA: glycine cleavage T C-terminal barrel domain-containing protein [Gemmatimonadaceae bacterium]|nr:glycine cleavage T C-terminal barrel domain-containing protein [Gemmatimonadaceae bacterium]